MGTGAVAQSHLRSAYSDISGLEQLKKGDDPAALREAAAQFESVFLDMWLKSMRDASSVFSEGSYLSSSEMDTHNEMLDHQWAVHIAESGGIGLRDVIVQQLSGNLDPSLDTSLDTKAGSQDSMALRVDSPLPSRSERDSVAVTNTGFKAAAFSSADEFVDRLLPIIRNGVAAAGLSPVAVLAQAALETGWGQRLIHDAEGNPSHNLFGIKSTQAKDHSVPVATMEHEHGRFVRREAEFRAYPDWQEAVADYVGFLSGSSRYQQAVASSQDGGRFADELQRAGYATDPQYATKIKQILRRLEGMVSARFAP
ncbi:MAG: flagellar assembly peptidoglycan hydrolase FlgJ [Gammaproteobacteria bacterium]|nr:flagellar assembly peptidoglycan hydrolase FlgJ [Gammaproteobacteria bacterium]